MSDDDFEIEEDLGDVIVNDPEDWPLDYVAARSKAFANLVTLVDQIQNEEALKETILMLRAIRFSFKQVPQGELSAIHGDKK